MKILHILPSNYLGGPTLRVLSVSKELREDFDIIMISPRGKGDFADLAKYYGFSTYQVNLKIPKHFTSIISIYENIKWLISIPISIIQISKIIKKEDIDIVHIHGLLNIPGAIAAKLSGKKLIWHLVGSIYPNWLISILMPFIIHISDYMIFIANKLADYYLRNRIKNLDDKYSVVYNGVDTKKYNPQNIDDIKTARLRKEFDIDNELIIGAVGNINPAKGYEYLIETVDLLMKSGCKFKLLIVGDKIKSQEKYYFKLENLIADLKLENNILFTGKRMDILDILSILDIFILSSIGEGTPMVILEAMAMEKPIIATDVGAVSEQIINAHDGIIVEPKDIDSLAKSIKYLLNDSKTRIIYGKNARKRAENIFSLEKSAERYKEIYKRIYNSQ